jgi:hypothetical protein
MSDLIALSSTLHPSLHRRGCQGDRRVSLVKIRSMKIRRTLTRPFAYASLPVALRCRTDAAGRRARREIKNALNHELCSAESIAMRRPAFPYPSSCRCRTELRTGRQEVTLYRDSSRGVAFLGLGPMNSNIATQKRSSLRRFWMFCFSISLSSVLSRLRYRSIFCSCLCKRTALSVIAGPTQAILFWNYPKLL